MMYWKRLMAVCVVLATLLGLGACGGDDSEREIPQDSSPRTTVSDQCLWPDVRVYLGRDVPSQKHTYVGENKGVVGYGCDFTISTAEESLVWSYFDLLETYGFFLVWEKDGRYGFCYNGANAPKGLVYDDGEYHFDIRLEKTDKSTIKISYVIVNGFSTVGIKGSIVTDPDATSPEVTVPEVTVPKATAPETTAPEVTVPDATAPTDIGKPDSDGTTLPDPLKFFGCGRGENQPYEDNGWVVSCKFDIDTGRQVTGELLALLESGEYPLSFICADKADYISTSASVFYSYYYDYTGSNNRVVGLKEKVGADRTPVAYDVKVTMYYNHRAGWIMLSVYFDENLELKDLGHRASKLPVDYTGSSDEELGSISRPDWNKNVLPCTACDGDGDCTKCNDYGYLWSTASQSYDRNCWKCNNSGVCQTCYGTGMR